MALKLVNERRQIKGLKPYSNLKSMLHAEKVGSAKAKAKPTDEASAAAEATKDVEAAVDLDASGHQVGREIDPPEGLPTGWKCIEKTYMSGTNAGETYCRFIGGPNNRHKGVTSVRAAILKDAEDRGLDGQALVAAYEDARKQSKAAKTAKPPNEDEAAAEGRQTKRAKSSAGELFRNLKGEVVMVSTNLVVQKPLKKLSDLENSDIDAMGVDDITSYEKELHLSSKRSMEDRVTRLEKEAQKTTLQANFFQKKKKGGGNAITHAKAMEVMAELTMGTDETSKSFGPRFLQAFLALSPIDRRMASGQEISRLEKIAMLKDADKLTMSERRTALKEKLWESRQSEALVAAQGGQQGGQNFWKKWAVQSQKAVEAEKPLTPEEVEMPKSAVQAEAVEDEKPLTPSPEEVEMPSAVQAEAVAEAVADEEPMAPSTEAEVPSTVSAEAPTAATIAEEVVLEVGDTTPAASDDLRVEDAPDQQVAV